MPGGMEQDQASVPAERLDRLQRKPGRRIFGSAAIFEERCRGLGECGYRLRVFSPGRDRSRSAAVYSQRLPRPLRLQRKSRPTKATFRIWRRSPDRNLMAAARIRPHPFRVPTPGSDQMEVVANGSLYRNYDFPEISNVLLSTAYREAFTKGGWMIVQESPGVIRAHYAKNGRNIWAMVSPNGPGMYTLNVADAGAVDREHRSRRRATWRCTEYCSTSINRLCRLLPMPRCSRQRTSWRRIKR